MADLATLLTRRQECKSRGQLILVTALALAAIFLGLAVIVNSAIFTENLATRSENVESTEALEYRHSVTQYMGEVVAFANENNHSSYSEIEQAVKDGTVDAEFYTSIQQAERGSGLALEYDSYTQGARIFQNDSSGFGNNNSNTPWTLATDIDNTRAFTFDVDSPGDFLLIADNGSHTWEFEIDDSADEVIVRNPATTEERCSYTTLESFDITDATVNGSPCPALVDTAAGESMQLRDAFPDDYSIEFQSASGITGNYSLVIDNDNVGTIRDSDYADSSGGTSPFVEPAMYSARFDPEYQTARVNYETEVRVAPGESP
jgi:hypothetical protein